MTSEELGVFACEDVVGYGAETVCGAEGVAEREHEGGFAGADGSGRVLGQHYTIIKQL